MGGLIISLALLGLRVSGSGVASAPIQMVSSSHNLCANVFFCALPTKPKGVSSTFAARHSVLRVSVGLHAMPPPAD